MTPTRALTFGPFAKGASARVVWLARAKGRWAMMPAALSLSPRCCAANLSLGSAHPLCARSGHWRECCAHARQTPVPRSLTSQQLLLVL